MIRPLLGAFVATIALAGTAAAQDATKPHGGPDLYGVGPSEGNWETTLSGTGTSNNDFDNHTFGITGSIGKYTTDNVLVGLRQSLNFSDVENGDDQTNFATRLFADYVFDLGRWRPYVGATLGYIYGENVNETFAAGPEVGVKYYADNNTFVYLNAEYQFTFEDAEDADNAADDGQYYYGMGVGFNF